MGEGRGTGWAVLVAWLLLAAALAARALYLGDGVPQFADSDDAMRLVVVEDLLAGQSWYDPVQHRLNTPFGAPMHWSRLVDLPIAGLVVLLQPLAGAAAPQLAAFVWPLLLLLPLLALSAALAIRLAGPEGLLLGLLLPAFSVITPTEFAPGRIDHHAVVLLLSLALLYCSIEAVRRPRFGIGAGLVAATALAIAIESLPAIVAAIAGFGLLWALRPGQAAALRYFGVGFALATLGHLLLAQPPVRWLEPACDALSVVYAAAAVGTGALCLVLPLLGLRTPAARLAAGAVLGAALGAGLLLLFPHCLAGPYAALDPWLARHWIEHVREAVPAWESLRGAPAFTAGALLPPLLGLAVAAHRLRHAPDAAKPEWLVYGLFVAFALAVTMVQVRGARLASELAAPAGAALIVAMRHRYLASGSLRRAAALLGSWLGFAGIGIAALVSVVLMALPDAAAGGSARNAGRGACLAPAAFEPLAAMPPARVMSFIDLGAHILVHSGHAVVGAPYHRNQDGVRDTLRFFNLPLEEARAILAERDIGIIVTCAAMPEARGLADAAETSFLSRLRTGDMPAWIEEVSAPGAALRLFRVGRD